jgi:hypothetical protein
MEISVINCPSGPVTSIQKMAHHNLKRKAGMEATLTQPSEDEEEVVDSPVLSQECNNNVSGSMIQGTYLS